MKKIILISIISIFVIGAGFASFFWFFVMDSDSDSFNSEEFEESVYEMDEIIANLDDQSGWISTEIMIEIEDSDHMNEIEHRSSELKADVNKVINSFTASEMRGKEGLENFSETLKNQFNDTLNHAVVTKASLVTIRVQNS